MKVTDATSVERDCAVADPPRRSPISRRGALRLGILGAVVAGVAVGAPAAFAQMPGYPSWEDVERAKANEGAKAGEITRIEGLIAQLQNDVAAKQAEAERLGAEYALAQEAYEDAYYRAESLQQQADAERERADSAAQKLGLLAAQQYRMGKSDPTLELFFSGSQTSADDLLARLGTMDKLVAANRDVYAEAIGARNSAQSLSDQAAVARDERDRLQKEAEQKMQAAQAAAEAAAAALARQAEYLDVLQAQLLALKDTTAKTVEAYKAGVEAERKAREERLRREREEAARRAREAEERRRREEEERRKKEQAAGNGGGSSGGGSGGGGGGGSSSGGSGSPAGTVQPSGWVRPAAGYISSWFGTRDSICGNGQCTNSGHRGIDFAAGYGAPIYAANSGTVIFRGYSGGWGNFIKVRHPDGTVTGYAHIRDGGYNVSNGQHVRAGQIIAFVGSTGASTGPHLHFEVYAGGSVRIDPAPFLRARGISV